MDKADYIQLLRKASVDDTTKFEPVSTVRPKTRGRPPKHYHPLLQKEKELTEILRRILPKSIADTLRPNGSRLAHLYGLPKTHKKDLAMRPILSATSTYNYPLAKWLDNKLKAVSTNSYTIIDIFKFVDELKDVTVKERSVLVSYDVCSLFTNVPLDETINILADKAFADNWFNQTHNLDISKSDLIELLTIATKDQLFQFDGSLYKQVDGVAMGSPLGPLLANTFLCAIEENLQRENQLPSFYRRYVDDTLVIMDDIPSAEAFLNILNGIHPSLRFTMELESDSGSLPFLGVEVIKNDCHLSTRVYRKATNTGLLLHYHSHVDSKYKRSLLNTMLHRAYCLSSTWEYFHDECNRIKEIFEALRYPRDLIDSSIESCLSKMKEKESREASNNIATDEIKITRFSLPFKDQKSANMVRRQLDSLSNMLQIKLQPVFTSRPIQDDIKPRELKSPLINQQSVVYLFKCGLCDADYVGYTRRHLHQRIEEHRHSTIGNHVKSSHGLTEVPDLSANFKILKKCSSKTDCLIHEMLYIRKIKPSLNIQSDSVKAKIFY